LEFGWNSAGIRLEFGSPPRRRRRRRRRRRYAAAVIARLQAEGFERANRGAPHPWFLTIKPGVVSPAKKALCRSLTSAQRARIEANRLVALERRTAGGVRDAMA
jgi:hypothetical protein